MSLSAHPSAGHAAPGQGDENALLARLPVDRVWSADDYKYRLSPGDELGVRFLLSPDLNAQVTVGPDGRGVFPLISGLSVAGLTVEEADAALAHAYGAYLRKPIVELSIYNYVGGQIYVAGEVKTPGARSIHGQTSITQAIADVGGLADTAKAGRVALLRRRPNGQVLMRVVDIAAILSGRAKDDILLLPGDVVFVPRSSIAEVDRIVRQYITNVLPFSAVYQINDGATGTLIR